MAYIYLEHLPGCPAICDDESDEVLYDYQECTCHKEITGKMNKENTLKLLKAFPHLYSGYTLSPRENLMCFGFECGDGWFDLIWRLSERLESLGVVALQVKEKFGTLRFYADGGEEAFTLIGEAEEESNRTCELCGQAGQLYCRSFWLKTLCTRCAKENGYEICVREETIY